MEFLLDSANIPLIKDSFELFPFSGATSNPTILKREGKVSFFKHFKEIRNIIGEDKTLHIQITSTNSKGILAEADAILERIDKNVFIKIPVMPQGLCAMKILKKRGINVTATAIYTKAQGYLAIEAGADYIAPYFNRMENLNIDPIAAIECLANQIERGGYKTKILAASFKNIGQVNAAFEAGAQSVTVDISILNEVFKAPSIQKAIDDFNADWENVFGKTSIDALKT
jgi:TalC/MipB family fructose-6-phosphate aldolase